MVSATSVAYGYESALVQLSYLGRAGVPPLLCPEWLLHSLVPACSEAASRLVGSFWQTLLAPLPGVLHCVSPIQLLGIQRTLLRSLDY